MRRFAGSLQDSGQVIKYGQGWKQFWLLPFLMLGALNPTTRNRPFKRCVLVTPSAHGCMEEGSTQDKHGVQLTEDYSRREEVK